MHSTKSPDHLPLFIAKMEKAGLHAAVIATFARYYRQVVAGARGLIHDQDIAPLGADELACAEALAPFIPDGDKALPYTVMIVLNGGLGTSMGLQQAKSLLTAKNGLSFLELLVRQAAGCGIQLALMNSYNTHQDTLTALARIQPGKPPRLFLQNQFPKILQSDLRPAVWPQAPNLEWNPPGHGDVYTALQISGLLAALLQTGVRYALISNSDNLGATPDPALLGWFSRRDLPFMMEVARRTPSDRKGGHLARHRSGRLILRESAQCPPNEMAAFEDIERYRFFNTNNIWINLGRLRDLLARTTQVDLPLILNPKTLNPRDAGSPPVYQVESAMGAAIGLFEEAAAVVVPRTRFMPVKKCSDLLALRSDRYILSATGRVAPNPDCACRNIKIQLDQRFFSLIDDFNARFGDGTPSLKDCEALTVEGDVRFEAGVILRGRVTISNTGTEQAVVSAGTVLDNTMLDNNGR